MVSPELIRRYPLFAGLSMDEITILAMAAEELEVEKGHWFFREGQELHELYLVLDGTVGICIELPRKEVVTSSLGAGEMFAWSALVPPHETTAGAKALSQCRVVRFDSRPICAGFESDWHFGYLMMEKMAEIIRQRLHSLRMEALPCYAA
jgi:CRP-like cAMP-binding protein